MKKNRMVLLLGGLCLMVGCFAPDKRKVCLPELTFSELLSDPAKYAGRRIRLTGFYFSGYEASVLYETPEGVRRSEVENGVWVYWPAKDEVAEVLHQHNGRALTVYGVVAYRSSGLGHLGLFKVGIDQIDRVELVTDK